MSDSILNLLLVDDEDSVREPLARHLRAEPYKYEVKDVATFDEALQALEETKGRFDVALIDEVLEEGTSGLDLLRQIKTQYQQIECILFTGWGMQSGLEALRAGAYRYFAKPFNLDELALTIRFAAQDKQIRQERQYLDALVRVGEGLTATTRQSEQLSLAWDFVREQLDVSTFFIGLLSPDGERVYFPLVYDRGQQVNLLDTILSRKRREWGLAGYVAKTGEEIVWFTVDEMKKVCKTKKIAPFIVNDPSASGFCLPLKMGDRIRGVLSAQSYHSRVFTSSLQNALRSLGSQLSVAMENSRLFAEAQQKTKDVERQASSLVALQELALTINSSLKPDEILMKTCQTAMEFFHADHSGLVLFDTDFEQGTVQAEYPNMNAQGLKMPLRGTPAEERLIATHQPLIIYDVRLEESLGVVRDILLGMNIQSILIVPVIGKKGLLGSFSLDAIKQQRIFTKEEIELCKTFANQVAVAIENARLFSISEETSKHLEGLIASSLDAVISIDGRKHITVYNKQAEEMLGYTSKEMIGQNVGLLHQDIDEAIRIWDEVHFQGKIVCREVTLKHKNGTRIPAILSARSIKDTEGNEIGQAGFLHARFVEDQLRALIHASQAISGTLEPDKVLQRIIESAIAAFPTAEKGAIHLYDERTGMLVMDAFKGYSSEVAKAVTFKPGEGRAGWVYEHSKPLVIGNVQENEISQQVDFKIAHKEVSEQKSTICVPLRIKGKVIGTLSLDNITFYDAFHNSDIELLSTFADQAAIAIDNSLRMQELEYMQRATAALAGVLEPPQVLQQIVKSASEVLQADSSAVWSFDNVSNQTIPEELVAYGIPKDQLERFRKQEPKQGGTAETVIERVWVGVADISDPEYAFMGPSTVELLNSIGARSFEGIALKVGNENLGVLYVNYNRPRNFTQEDRGILETFANHAAIALKKARLSNQVKIARDAASVIAQIVALEKDIQETWDSIVAGTKEALPCDAVVLYRYNEDSGELGYPPAMAGVNYPEKASRLPSVPEHSIVWKVLRSDDLLIVNDATSDDSLTQNRRFTIEEGIKSLVGIPLKAGDRRVGVMFVNYRNKHRFTQDELTHIKLFANQIAVAIRNAQLLERTRKQAETLEGLYEAGKAVTGLLDLNEILERIAEQAWRLVGRPAGYTSIRLVENDKAEVVAAYPPEELAQSRAEIPEIDLMAGVKGRFGVTGRAIRTGVSQLVNDVGSDNDYLPSHPQTCSELAVPIKLGERAIGVINVESPELRAFSKSDEHTLISLASYAAIAINNAQLYERTRGQAEILGGLYEAGKAITSTLAVGEVLSRIAVQALNIGGAKLEEGCFSHIALCEGNKLKFIAASPTEMLDALNRVEIDLEASPKKGIAGRAVLTGLSQNVPDVKAAPDYIVSKENINSQLSVPLTIGERIIGVLSIEHPKPAEFGDEDVKNVESLAAQAAVAIQNAQQYEELKKTKGLVGTRTALAWMGMVSSIWRHAITRDTVTIRDQIKLLRGDLTSLSESGIINKRLEMIDRLANRILEKPITAPLSAKEGAISISLNKLIRERVNSLWAHDLYKPVKLDLNFTLEDSATVRASPEWVQRALDILIDNAIDAMQGLPKPHLTISTCRLEDQAEVLIRDNGHGIPVEVQEHLFQEPIHKAQGEKGQGMGFLFAQAIVQTYGGEIRVKETGARGTVMVISLPLEVHPEYFQ